MTEEVSSDVEVVLPTPSTVEVDGEEVQIAEMRVKQLTQVIKLINPFVSSIVKEGKGGLNVALLIMQYPDEIVDMVAVMVGKPREWVENLTSEKLVDIVTALIEVNLSFFIQKLLPSILRGMGQLQEKTKGVPLRG